MKIAKEKRGENCEMYENKIKNVEERSALLIQQSFYFRGYFSPK